MREKNNNKRKINEITYKMYKNHLVEIIGDCRRKYYNKLLEEIKMTIKESWKMLK